MLCGKVLGALRASEELADGLVRPVLEAYLNREASGVLLTCEAKEFEDCLFKSYIGWNCHESETVATLFKNGRRVP